MEEAFVSIIIPCYNQGKFLSDTINSVLYQTYTRWECIIINDGSTDNTNDIAQKFTKLDNRIKLFYQPNNGLAAARNYGISLSTGKYILPLDSDDLINPGYINKAVTIMEQYPNVEIIYSDAELFGIKKGKWNLPEYSVEMMLGQNCIFCSAIFRRETFYKTSGYRENLKYGFQDWDLWLSIIELGGDVCKIHETLFYYRQRSNTMINSKTNQQFEHLRRTIWENHKYLYSKVCFLPKNSFEFINIYNSLEYNLGKKIISFLKKIYSYKNKYRSKRNKYKLPLYHNQPTNKDIDYTIY